MDNEIYFVGYASGLAARDTGCAEGPIKLQGSPFLKELAQDGIHYHWHKMLSPQSYGSRQERIAALCKALGQEVGALVQDKKFFIVFGGDHSSAIGTWSGASFGVHAQGPLGLIWIDAHMDAHRPDTSHTGNVHGMPVACLLGQGYSDLTHLFGYSPYIEPQNLYLIGMRSYDPLEESFLRERGVQIATMNDVRKRGLTTVIKEAIAHVTRNTVAFGLSLDLDAMDPKDAPGTGYWEAEGIAAIDLAAALTLFHHDSRLVGCEIVEFDPTKDRLAQTEKLIPTFIRGIITGNKPQGVQP